MQEVVSLIESKLDNDAQFRPNSLHSLQSLTNQLLPDICRSEEMKQQLKWHQLMLMRLPPVLRDPIAWPVSFWDEEVSRLMRRSVSTTQNSAE